MKPLGIPLFSQSRSADELNVDDSTMTSLTGSESHHGFGGRASMMGGVPGTATSTPGHGGSLLKFPANNSPKSTKWADG